MAAECPFNKVLIVCTIFFSISSFCGSSVLSTIDEQSRMKEDETRTHSCEIINQEIPDFAPLILRATNPPEFIFPDKSGAIRLAPGEVIKLACTGANNNLIIAGKPEADVKCVSGTKFLVTEATGASVMRNFSQLTCELIPQNIVRYKTTVDELCKAPNKAIEIIFMLKQDGFLRVMDICFHEPSLDTIFTRFDMPASIMHFRKNFTNPIFKTNLFPLKNVDNLYKRKRQQDTISAILGSKELAKKYISDTGDHFLSRGHLAARADFLYESQQYSTYYYVNVAPQWQTLNANNWKTLEEDLRNFATSNECNLTVLTGTYGVASLPDVDGNYRPISLFLDSKNKSQINVPALFWKVAYEPSTGYAVAFASVNNPYLYQIPKNLILCNNICYKLKWLKWSPEDIKKGYSYCCEVSEIREHIQNIPNFKINGVLGKSHSSKHLDASRNEIKALILSMILMCVKL